MSDHAGLVMICYDHRFGDTPDVSDRAIFLWSDVIRDLYDASDVSSHAIPEMVRYEEDPTDDRIDGGECT